MTIDAIGAGNVATVTATGAPSSAALQAQLDRCEKQLSDQVNCSSANTTAGKAKIRELSDRISVLKQHMEQAATPRKTTSPAIQPVSATPASGPHDPGWLLDLYA